MKWAILCSTILLLGCQTNPPIIVKQKFPEANKDLMVPCPELKLADTKSSKLTDLMDTVIDNYNEYHDCRSKVNDWIFWYQEQKKIFDSVK